MEFNRTLTCSLMCQKCGKVGKQLCRYGSPFCIDCCGWGHDGCRGGTPPMKLKPGLPMEQIMRDKAEYVHDKKV